MRLLPAWVLALFVLLEHINLQRDSQLVPSVQQERLMVLLEERPLVQVVPQVILVLNLNLAIKRER